jgi:hypothetical protein
VQSQPFRLRGGLDPFPGRRSLRSLALGWRLSALRAGRWLHSLAAVGCKCVTKSIVGLLTLFLLASPVVAQQPRAQALPPNDGSTTLFRGLFHFHKIEPEPVANLYRANYDYANLIVVVYGDPRNIEVDKFCRSTLSRGGAVLIAADTDLSLGSFFPQGADIRISGARVQLPEPENVDNGQPTRPIALPLPVNDLNPFSGVQRVATYEPSFLWSTKSPPGVAMKAVAGFPLKVPVMNDAGQRGQRIPALPFAMTSDDRGTLRCMVLADPDVFSNRMIYTSGRAENATDNLKFANNTVQWLKGTGRTKCLFVENGAVMPKFDEFQFSSIPVGPQMPPPPIPNFDITKPEIQKGLADMVNKSVDQAQQNDVMNRGLLNMFGGRKAVLLAVLAGLLLAVTYLVFRYRTVVNWYRRTFRPIPRDPAMLGPDVPVGSLEHRRLELLRSADYGPVVRPVVRQLFQDRGLPAEYTGDKLPPVDVDVRRPEFLRDAIRSLWAVLHTTSPVGYGRWKELEPLLAAVRAAADDDRWRFVAT